MPNLDINQSKASLDYFFQHDSSWLSSIKINSYPVAVIFWNLLLVAIPYLLCHGLKRYWQRTKFKTWYQKLSGLGLFGLWLLFIPNTAYIITDVRHIANVCPLTSPNNVCLQGSWMIMIFFTYAIIGWLSFVFLTRQMRDLVKKIYGQRLAQWFIAVIIPLISLGVLLGLLNRWNSWELFTSPWLLLETIWLYFSQLIYFGNWLIFSLFLYILYWIGNMIFKELPNIRLFKK